MWAELEVVAAGVRAVVVLKETTDQEMCPLEVGGRNLFCSYTVFYRALPSYFPTCCWLLAGRLFLGIYRTRWRGQGERPRQGKRRASGQGQGREEGCSSGSCFCECI